MAFAIMASAKVTKIKVQQARELGRSIRMSWHKNWADVGPINQIVEFAYIAIKA